MKPPKTKPVDTKPCACAAAAALRGYLVLDPDCKANRCKELRK